MAARKTPSKGGKPDKLIRNAVMIEIHREMPVPDPRGGKTKTGKPKMVRMRKLRLLATALVNAGIRGDVSAIKEIADRIDGKVVQKVAGDPDAPPIKHEHSGKGGGAIKHDYSGLSDDALSRLHAEKVGPARSD